MLVYDWLVDGTETIELHAGSLRFTAYVGGEGPLVVCLHGFPDNARSFRAQVPALIEAGYRVLVPTLRGYEPSSQALDGSYYVIDLVEDLLAWIDELGADRIRLVGHDWGAIIAYATAALAPARLVSMVTIAVPHLRRFLPAMTTVMPEQLRRSWYALLFQLRGVSDLVFAHDLVPGQGGVIAKLWRDWSPGWRPPPEQFAAVEATFAQPGVEEAAMRYYRALFSSPSRRWWASWKLLVARTSVPTLAMTGRLDGCVDTRLHDFGDWREDYLGPAELVRIDDAGHFLHQERPEPVNEAIIDWLRRHDAADSSLGPRGESRGSVRQ